MAIMSGGNMFNSESSAALLMTLIAGLSTLVGALVVIITGRRDKKILEVAMGFAAGVMISASFLDLLPEAREYLGSAKGELGETILLVLFFAIGIVLAAIVDKLIPHTCCHDHDHHHHHSEDEECEDEINRVGIVSAVATGLHNFPEGIALFFAGYESTSLGIALTLAVILHNIPGGIAIAAPVYFSSGSKLKAFLYALIPSLVQPLGALLACIFLKQIMSAMIMGIMFALVSGFLLFAALMELYPASQGHDCSKLSSIALFAGIVFMPLTHLFTHSH